MAGIPLKTVVWVLCLLPVFLFPAIESSGGVIAFDEITLSGHPVFIRALTKGRFFPAGGERISIQISQENPQKILTGGDGYGRLKINPKNPGFIKITVTYGQDIDTAKLLVMDASESALVIEMDSALRTGMFAPNAMQDSQEVLKNLSSKYRLIYLHGIEGRHRSKSWLEANHFPEGIVLQNRGSDTLIDLNRKNIKMEGYIGSAETASAAVPYVKHTLTFAESTKVISAGTWEEVQDILESRNDRE